MARINRRTLFAISAAALIPSSFGNFWARETARVDSLQPVADATTNLKLLKLRDGFSYQSFSWAGDEMIDGEVIPMKHDGMAAFPDSSGGVTLLRNHEEGIGKRVGGDSAPNYDGFEIPPGTEGAPDGFPGFGGGVTAVSLNAGCAPTTKAMLSGTTINCAGGKTSWGSWLTCEEIVLRASRVGAKDHGFVFEVPMEGQTSAQPIVDMGFFRHEAAVLDPTSGIVYLTEDNDPHSGFYRFLPFNLEAKPGALEKGGSLEMMRIKGKSNADLRTPVTGDEYAVEWVSISEPNHDPERFDADEFGGNIVGVGKSGPYLQGEAAGGVRFARGEGAWFHNGSIYWVDTAGGAYGTGAIWEYEPIQMRLRSFYVSPNEQTVDSPDNITLHENGLLLACEDGGGLVDGNKIIIRGTRLLALGREGHVVEIAENNIVIDRPIPGKPEITLDDYRRSEWAGACFSPDGSTLFVNIYEPGITFAISGTWNSLI